MPTVRTRFAPSPTGSLHVGGVRTALYCLLHARHHGGRFVLRIEDTDRARSSDAAARGILTDMTWLGLDWDEGPDRDDGIGGPWYQSQRLAIYDAVLGTLVASGHAYEAWESREELLAMRSAAQERKENFRYRRVPYSADDLARFKAEGRTPVVRLINPGRDIVIDDRILGEVRVPADELEDIVIRKADGFPTYHFAVVVDDHDMQITQILRGQEHLKNTAKHLGITEALGWELPSPGHLPTIDNPAGGKMSKRDKARAARDAARAEAKARGVQGWGWLAAEAGLDEADVVAFMKKKHDSVATAEAIATTLGADLPMIEVLDFRKGGYLPEALLNYLALLGWNPGDDREVLSMDEMIEAFTLDRVGKTSARFDPTKLSWLNGVYMRSLADDRLMQLMDRWLEVYPSRLAGCDRATRHELLTLYRERAATFVDLERQSAYLFAPPTTWDEKAVKKHLLKGGGLERLAAARAALAGAEWSTPGLEAAFESLLDQTGESLGKLAQPVRIAVCGGPVSPPLYDTLAFLTRDEVLARIDACLAAFASESPS